MGSMMANFKGHKAAKLQSKGDVAGARKLYAEAYAAGMNETRLLLAYSVLLIRENSFQEAKELLVKTQKAPGITAEQKQQLFMNYAVCCFKLGEVERGIDLLEKQHVRQPSGLIYGTLGCLYVEAGMTEKALAFNEQALQYDDEDPICLDNMGQTYYRLLGDKEKAKPYFDAALKVKPGQIDTLWFLSRYDIEAGNKEAALEKLRTALEGRFSPMNFANKAMVEAEIKRIEAQG